MSSLRNTLLLLRTRFAAAPVLFAAFVFACASSGFAAGTASTTMLTMTAAGSAVTAVPAKTAVTLKASVTTGTGATVTPGQVLFCDASVNYCQFSSLGLAQLVSTPSGSSQIGVATMTFVPGPGVHSYKAVFLGTGSYLTSTSAPQTLTVTASTATTTALTSSGTTGAYGLSAVVTGSGPALAPTGSITFTDTTNKNVLGTGAPAAPAVSFTLTNPVQPASGYVCQMASADFNNDGILDIAVGSGCQAVPYSVSPVPNPLTILLGKGDGTFTLSTASPYKNTAVSGILAGDFNNDGKQDLVVSVAGNAPVLLPGNGDGTFGSPVGLGLSCPAGNLGPMAAADFNADGNQDLVIGCVTTTTGNTYTSSISVLLGNGAGAFTLGSSASYATLVGEFFAVGDFNGDGLPDLVIDGFNYGTNQAYGVVILLGKGGSFGAPSLVYTSGGGIVDQEIAVADLNGDGKADLVKADINSNGYSILAGLLGKGDGTFAAPVLTQTTDLYYPQTIASADFNGDGKTDVALFDYSDLRMMTSNGDGSFTSAASALGVTSDSDQCAVIIGDFNSDGVPDIYASTSDFAYGYTVLSQRKTTETAALTGIAVPGTGTHMVTATYPGDSAYTTSTSPAVSVTAAPVATTLTLVSSTATSVAGSQIVLTATLAPYSAGSLSTNTETITFFNGTTSLGTGILSSGVATLNLTSLPAGNASITAAYASDGNFASATSPAIPIQVAGGGATVVFAPASLNFGTQAVGVTSAAQTVKLTNGGTVPLTISSIAIAGDFGQAGSCVTLAVGASCTLSVTFTPTVPGSRSGTITVTSNASVQTLALSGTGGTFSLSAGTPTLTIASPGGAATSSLLLTAVTGFSGNLALTCALTYQGQGAATDAPTCSVSPTSVSLSSGGTGSSTLTVSTTAATASLQPSRTPAAFAFAGLVLVGLLARRRPFRGSLLAVLLLAALGFAAGCSTGTTQTTTTTTNPTPANPGTSLGNYQVTVTATSPSASATLNLPLTLQ